MSFDLPRAELCCEIGKYFLERKNFHNAIYWYETALNIPKNEYAGGFVLPDCYDYIPFCSCVYVMTDWETIKKQRNTMRRLGHINLIPRHIYIINNILTVYKNLTDRKRLLFTGQECAELRIL